jgi:3-isopropylmalate/(R)-2-methylmalate dehydratase small subunit
MKAFRRVSGRMAPLPRANVDTDQIIPKQFLKRIERSGFGPFLFDSWRNEDPDFVLNRTEYKDAKILVAGPNFGCGSSREHAAWAIEDYGFRAVIAPSFGDIFRNNATKIGLLPVELAFEEVDRLLGIAVEDPAYLLTIDLEAGTVSGEGAEFQFEIDAFTRRRLLEGLDDVGLTLRRDAEIAAFEAARPSWLPADRQQPAETG